MGIESNQWGSEFMINLIKLRIYMDVYIWFPRWYLTNQQPYSHTVLLDGRCQIVHLRKTYPYSLTCTHTDVAE